MPVVTTIKLTGENHEDVDTVCTQIKRISDESGVKLRGPIPLPTRKLVVPCRKAPSGEGSETYDHWEMRIHKRLIDLSTSSEVLKQIININIEPGVEVDVTIHTS